MSYFLSSLRYSLTLLVSVLLLITGLACAQEAPQTSSKPWPVESPVLLRSQVILSRQDESELAADKTYRLSDLIDIAEERNPQTQAAWQKAKAAAAKLGIARSELYPTLEVVAPLVNDSTAILFKTYYKQNLFLFRPAVEMSYTVLDFGERRAHIDAEKAALLATNLNFNETHRQVIYNVVSAYYKVMLALSRKQAAQVALMNAKTIQEAVEERLAQGLATLPDKLDAQAATAQAEYALATVQGEEDIARGELASILRVSPLINLKFANLDETAGLNANSPNAQQAITDALHFRPDFLAKIQEIASAQAEVREKRTAYFPKLTLSANYGRLIAYANQDMSPYLYGQVPVYQWEAKFSWVMFDGGRRRNELNLAKAHYEEALAEEQESKDQVEYQVWQAYTNLQTAQKQLVASGRLLTASQTSFEEASEAYHDGVRNLIDVTTAQKNLAAAQNTFVEARIQILVDMAELAYQMGDLVHIGKPVSGAS